MQTPRDRIARRRVRRLAGARRVHLPRRGKRPPAEPEFVPENRRSAQGQRSHTTVRIVHQ